MLPIRMQAIATRVSVMMRGMLELEAVSELVKPVAGTGMVSSSVGA